MKAAILGTGTVGQTIAEILLAQGHTVTIGTRDPKATLARREPDAMGHPAYAVWASQHPQAELKTMADAVDGADWIFVATNGKATLEALRSVGADLLAGRVVVDISNPLDFSQGFPPSLFVCNTDSLGERIQAGFPEAKVVKTLNTVSSAVMANPGAIPGGQPTMFVCGNDAQAKKAVFQWLQDLGWSDVLDLGDITSSRAMEMLLPIWVRTLGIVGTPMFGLRVVR